MATQGAELLLSQYLLPRLPIEGEPKAGDPFDNRGERNPSRYGKRNETDPKSYG